MFFGPTGRPFVGVGEQGGQPDRQINFESFRPCMQQLPKVM